MAGSKEGVKLVANNKKAYFDYFIEDKYEAGVALHGTEVKSIRMGKCSIKESGFKTARCLSMECTSARMKKEIFLIRIRCV